MSKNGPIGRKTVIDLLATVAGHDAVPGTALYMIVLAIRAYLTYWHPYEEGESIAPKAMAVTTILRQQGLNSTKASSLAKILRPADVPPGPRVSKQENTSIEGRSKVVEPPMDKVMNPVLMGRA